MYSQVPGFLAYNTILIVTIQIIILHPTVIISFINLYLTFNVSTFAY